MRQKWAFALWFILLMAFLVACDGGETAQPTAPTQVGGEPPYDETGNVAVPANATKIYIVYSPESQDFMPELIRRFNQSYADGKNPLTGAPLASGETPIYVLGTDPVTGSSGTVAQGILNAIIAPTNENVYKPTLFMPSTSNWLAWVNSNTGRTVFDLGSAQPVALSPVILGIWEDRLQQLEQLTGKDRTQIGWQDILSVLQNGWQDGRQAVYYGHTDPRQSSTGLSATIEEYYACARANGFTGRRLELDQVTKPEVQACMRDIQALVRHYSRRTEDFLGYFGQGPDYLDMLALEEVDLICINRGAMQGTEQCLKPQGGTLSAIYPADGTLWHERAVAVVEYDVAQGGWTTQAQREAAKVFVDYLVTADAQSYIMTFGFRPANPNVAIGFPLDPQFGVTVDIQAPTLDNPDIEVINTIQQSWSVVKKQADIMLLMDVSGSMNDEGRIDQARVAARTFIENLETTNRVGLTIFSNTVTEVVPLGLLESNKAEILAIVDSLTANGGTELYQALTVTTQALNDTTDSDRVRALVLLSDGEDTGSAGYTLQNAIEVIGASRDSLNPVIVIPLAYGSGADITALNQIARTSKTSVQSGSPDNINALLRLLSSFF